MLAQRLEEPIKLQKILTLSSLLAEVKAITEVVPRLPAMVEKRAIATLIDRFWLDDTDCYWPDQDVTITYKDY